jgi:hypothetical protein
MLCESPTTLSMRVDGREAGRPEGEVHTVTAGVYDELLDQVLERLTRPGGDITENIARMQAPHQTVAMRELSEDLILTIRRTGRTASYVQVGFPFALVERPVDHPTVTGCELRLCVRGERIREVQRRALDANLGFDVSVLDAEAFADRCRCMAAATSSCLYINPYDYLGDSFIGTYLRETMTRAYGLPADGYYTRFIDHLSSLADARPLNEAIRRAGPSHLVVLPDLIDTHFRGTLELLPALVSAGSPTFLVGRNTAVHPWARRVYRTRDADPLLRDSNIEDYMDDCLAAFLGARPALSRPHPTRLADIRDGVVFINPFSSLPERDVPPGLVLNLVAALSAAGVRRILISRGAPGIAKDEAASAEVACRIENVAGMTEVCQRGFDNLGAMALELEAENVVLGISPDTSVPHLLNSLGIPVLTLYSRTFWDGMCVQSLASDSPLGFCRYQTSQLPLLFDRAAIPPVETLQRVLEELVTSVPPREETEAVLAAYGQELTTLSSTGEADLARAFGALADLHGRLSELCGLGAVAELFGVAAFHPCLLGRNQRRTRRLMCSLFRISPVYKIAEARRAFTQPESRGE